MLRIEFETENAAFEGDREGEVVRILRLIASQIERGSSSAPVLDSNGNTIGSFVLERELDQ